MRTQRMSLLKCCTDFEKHIRSIHKSNGSIGESDVKQKQYKQTKRCVNK